MDTTVMLPLGGSEFPVSRALMVKTFQDIHALLSKDIRLQESGIPTVEQLEKLFLDFINSDEFQKRLSERRFISRLYSPGDCSAILSSL